MFIVYIIGIKNTLSKNGIRLNMDLIKASLIQFIMECESANHGHWCQQTNGEVTIDVFVLTGPQTNSWFARKHEKHLQVYLPGPMFHWASSLPCAGIIINDDSLNICYSVKTSDEHIYRLHIRMPLPNERILMIKECQTVQFAERPNLATDYEPELVADKYIPCEYQ